MIEAMAGNVMLAQGAKVFCFFSSEKKCFLERVRAADQSGSD
jgi:hypothetical protein